MMDSMMEIQYTRFRGSIRLVCPIDDTQIRASNRLMLYCIKRHASTYATQHDTTDTILNLHATTGSGHASSTFIVACAWLGSPKPMIPGKLFDQSRGSLPEYLVRCISDDCMIHELTCMCITSVVDAL